MIRVFQQYISLRSAVLCVIESVLMAFGLLLGVRIWLWNAPAGFEEYVSVPAVLLPIGFVVAVVQTCFSLNGLYDFRTTRRRTEQSLQVTNAIGLSCLLFGVTCMMFPELPVAHGSLIADLAMVVIVIVMLRIIPASWWTAIRPGDVVIIGTGQLALRMADAIDRRPDLGLRVVKFIGDGNDNCVAPGTANELEAVVEQNGIRWIIVAVENQRGALPIRSLVTLRVSGVTIEDAQTMLARLTGRVWLETVRPSWFVFSGGFRRSRTTAVLKRTSDIMFSLVGLILTLPVMAIVAIVIRVHSKGPILYRQTRVGYRGRQFELLKFRSMRIDAEAGTGAQWSVISDPRVTRVGAVLRRFRLDELPQFINVLRGDMSLVGPRPERPFFTEQLRERIPYYDERHSVRPGITGWAQVRYRYGASFEDAVRKLEYDLFYLKNVSFLFDLTIMLQTVRTVLFGHEWVESSETAVKHPAVPAAVASFHAIRNAPDGAPGISRQPMTTSNT